MTRLLGVPWSAFADSGSAARHPSCDVLPVGYAVDAIASCRRGVTRARAATSPAAARPCRVVRTTIVGGRPWNVMQGAPGAEMTAAEFGRAVEEQVGRVIVGKADQTRLLIVALLADGHVLLDDVPGVAKTLLVRTLSAALGLELLAHPVHARPSARPTSPARWSSTREPGSSSSARGRCSPTSSSPTRSTARRPARSRRSSRRWRSGASPWTARRTRCRAPFMVLATQNPVELKGTFPLPEAQVDRFLLCLRMGYPSAGRRGAHARAVPQRATRSPRCAPSSARTICARCAPRCAPCTSPPTSPATSWRSRGRRASPPLLRLGASPRASLALQHAAQAVAALAGRDFVTPDDVQELVAPVLAHRLLLARDAAHRRALGRGRPRRGRRPACRCRRRPKGTRRPRREPEALVRLRSILWACLAGLVGRRAPALRRRSPSPRWRRRPSRPSSP